jgi:lipopolysaccharide export system permease protein
MFSMPRIIPVVFLSIASIMTFGNLAENYEFAAMKSAGILQRAMRSLTLLFFISMLLLPTM